VAPPPALHMPYSPPYFFVHQQAIG